MRFNARKQYYYDPALFARNDVKTALRIQAEYVRKHAPIPPPHFFEIDRSDQEIDHLWHVPKSDRSHFSRELNVPAINMFEKPDWRLTKLGIIPQRRDKFWLANLILQEPAIDYFPMRGDMVFWSGYRYMIINVALPPEAYWQQTGVWLGLTVECIIVPEGDAKPLPLDRLVTAIPAEQPTTAPLSTPSPKMLPEV